MSRDGFVQELERQMKSHGLPLSEFNFQGYSPYNSYQKNQSQPPPTTLLPPIMLSDPNKKVSRSRLQHLSITQSGRWCGFPDARCYHGRHPQPLGDGGVDGRRRARQRRPHAVVTQRPLGRATADFTRPSRTPRRTPLRAETADAHQPHRARRRGHPRYRHDCMILASRGLGLNLKSH